MVLTLFAGWELTVRDPMLDLRFFRSHRFSASAVVGDPGVLRPVRLGVLPLHLHAECARLHPAGGRAAADSDRGGDRARRAGGHVARPAGGREDPGRGRPGHPGTFAVGDLPDHGRVRVRSDARRHPSHGVRNERRHGTGHRGRDGLAAPGQGRRGIGGERHHPAGRGRPRGRRAGIGAELGLHRPDGGQGERAAGRRGTRGRGQPAGRHRGRGEAPGAGGPGPRHRRPGRLHPRHGHDRAGGRRCRPARCARRAGLAAAPRDPPGRGAAGGERGRAGSRTGDGGHVTNTGSQDAEPAPAGRRGRPRDAGADERIRAAAVRLLLERGFDRMTVDEVADLAGVAKATVYRRYPSKEEMAADAMHRLFDVQIPVPDTGSIQTDLAQVYSNLLTFAWSPQGAAFLRLAAVECGRDRRVAALYREMLLERLAYSRTLVDRAVARGELRADVDVETFFDWLPGLVMFRILADRPLPGLEAVPALVEMTLSGVVPQR